MAQDKERILPLNNSLEWLNPETYLPVLAPDLAKEYEAYFAVEDDTYGIADELSEIQFFAAGMVRYAGSPIRSDSMAINTYTGKLLINPATGEPFTLESVGIDRELCKGLTTGFEGRERQVAELTVAMYRVLHPKTD